MRNVVLMYELDTLSGVSDTIGIRGQGMRFIPRRSVRKGDKLAIGLKTGLVRWA